MDLGQRENQLKQRLERISALEEEIRGKELTLKNREGAKKQTLLRLSPTLWDQVTAWAAEDFRSINSQIEYLLTQAVKEHYKK